MAKRIAVIAVAMLICWGGAAFAGYNATLSAATHRGQLYNYETWDAEILWYGTFFDDAFRRTYIDKTIELKHMEPDEADRFMDEEERRQSRGWDLFVVMYTKKDFRKFSMEPDSFWQALITTSSGEQVRASDIEAVPITPYLKAVYPHFNRWSKAYLVTFPKVDLGEKAVVTLRSVLGESTLAWKIRGEGNQKSPPRKRRW